MGLWHVSVCTSPVSTRAPCLLQGIKWVIKREEPNGLRVIQQSQPKYIDTVRTPKPGAAGLVCGKGVGLPCSKPLTQRLLLACLQVIHCIENGLPLLIENLPEEIDPALDSVIQVSSCHGCGAAHVPLAGVRLHVLLPGARQYIFYAASPSARPAVMLQKKVTKRGRALVLKLGDQEVEYDPRFKLYLHTKISNPHYKPEVAAQTTLINFSVTVSVLTRHVVATRRTPNLGWQLTLCVQPCLPSAAGEGAGRPAAGAGGRGGMAAGCN